MADFNPVIIAFLCNWCSYGGADNAGGLKLQYPSNIRCIRVMCSGRVDPQFVMKAFRNGADGVMVLGCHPGDCHYRNGNIKTLKRFALFTKMLSQFGIDQDRFMLDWVAAGEGKKFAQVATLMTERIKKLGPLTLDGCVERKVA